MWLIFLVEMFHAVIKVLSEQCLHLVLFSALWRPYLKPQMSQKGLSDAEGEW